MERHAAWLAALVVVLAVWLGLLWCAAKSKKSNTARTQELRPPESTEQQVNGDVGDGPPGETAPAMIEVVESTGNEWRCVAEEAEEQRDGLSIIKAVVPTAHNSTPAKSAAKVSSSTGVDAALAVR